MKSLTYEESLEYRPWRDDLTDKECSWDLICSVYPSSHPLYQGTNYPTWPLKYGTRTGDLYILNKIFLLLSSF